MFLMTAAVNSEVVAEPRIKDNEFQIREFWNWRLKLTAHVSSANLAGVNDIEGCARDAISKVVEPVKRAAIET